MTNKKKKAPAKSGGYSYDKVVKNFDKNGKKIFFRYEGKKKVRTSLAEYEKVQATKKYFKTKYKTDWQKKYKSAQSEIKGVSEQQKKKDKEFTEKQKKLDTVNIDPQTTFANSMPTDVETQVLRYGTAEISLNGAIKKIDKNNLIDARLFFSEIADLFYDRWHEKSDAGQKLPSPNILYNWYIKTTVKYKTKKVINEIFITLDKTNFSFDTKYFFTLLQRLFKNYF